MDLEQKQDCSEQTAPVTMLGYQLTEVCTLADRTGKLSQWLHNLALEEHILWKSYSSNRYHNTLNLKCHSPTKKMKFVT